MVLHSDEHAVGQAPDLPLARNLYLNESDANEIETVVDEERLCAARKQHVAGVCPVQRREQFDPAGPG